MGILFKATVKGCSLEAIHLHACAGFTDAGRKGVVSRKNRTLDISGWMESSFMDTHSDA